MKWEWEPGSGFRHEQAPHSGLAAETGWAASERDTGDEGKGVLQSPAGWLQSAKGPHVCALTGPSGLQVAWHVQGAAGHHQQQAQPVEVHTGQKAASVIASGTFKAGHMWARA